MSLSSAQQDATSKELNRNFELADVTPDEICTDLGISRGDLDAIMDVRGERPEDVWMLRDYLEAAILDRGLNPAPYSSPTEAMRSSAERWFPMRPSGKAAQTVVEQADARGRASCR